MSEEIEIEEAVVAEITEKEPTPEPAPATEPVAAEPAAPERDPYSEGGKRLAPAVWAEIVAHWEHGTMRAATMSKEYGVSRTSISKYFRRHGVGKFGCKAAEIRKIVEAKVVGDAAASVATSAATIFESKRAERIIETREHTYSLSRVVLGRTLAIAKDIANGIRKEADCANDLKALRHMEALIEKNLANRLKALKADQDIDIEEMPELRIRDLSQEEIDTLAAADKDEELDFDLPTSADELDDEIVEEGGPLPSP